MDEERPVTREVAEALFRELREAMSAGEEQVNLAMGGHELRITHMPDGGLAIGVPGEEGYFRMYVEPAARPDGYSEELPFVPGESVTLTHTDRGVALMWWAPPAPALLLSSLMEQSEAAGWVLEDEQETPAVGVRNWRYRRAESERLLMDARGMVTLMDHGAE